MGNIWGIHHLIPHPQTPPRSVSWVTVQLEDWSERTLSLIYTVGPGAELKLPPSAAPVQTDGLWQTTCFEAFLKSATSDAYSELNFSPSFAWAAYAFDGHRTGRRPLKMHLDPELAVSIDKVPSYSLIAEFDVRALETEPVALNATAVIEEMDGTKSYWALAHPPSGPPDFHDPACFVLQRPPTQ